MKKIILMLAVVLALPALGQTNEDSLAIEKTITDYIEGLATGNAERIQMGDSERIVGNEHQEVRVHCRWKQASGIRRQSYS
jgi:hypothetical protein